MKDKLQNYNVSKRFIIWVETDVKAESLTDAVAKAEALKPADFAEFDRPMTDWEPIKGTSVSEDWI